MIDDARDSVVSAATRAHTLQHLTDVRSALEDLQGTGRAFTADDVHTLVPEATGRLLDGHPALLGGLISQEARAGRIDCIGWCTSRRRPGYPTRMWVGRREAA